MSPTIAIVGAGPVGLEAALCAAQRGWDVRLYEAGQAGQHVRQWGHVTFFSPWKLNMGPVGCGLLKTQPQPEAFPTGAQFVQEYLTPLFEHPLLQGRVHTGTRVEGIARARAFKGELVGQEARAQGPFVLSLRGPEGARFEHADVVFDASGAYTHPNHMGPGGLPVPGSQELGARITHWVPDVLGEDRDTYADRRVMVVGSGYSAITSIAHLLKLREQAPKTHVLWLIHQDTPPYTIIEGDTLPQRAALAELGNRAASGQVEGVEPMLQAQVMGLRLAPERNQIDVEVLGPQGALTHQVERIISNVGYRPDTELYRELQVHLCYASEGPMKLAASLMAQSGGSADCLAQVSQGVEVLKTPEPDFWVVGAKSYGRNSAFLLKIGYEQVHEIFEHLDKTERFQQL